MVPSLCSEQAKQSQPFFMRLLRPWGLAMTGKGILFAFGMKYRLIDRKKRDFILSVHT